MVDLGLIQLIAGNGLMGFEDLDFSLAIAATYVSFPFFS